ncbi:hypothetical protein EVAR_53450_1 [Eumeta japonica]|uniref:Uncharacterized protein n=1 Tax=Eumeta variegata TaxID=151549 RepID=A0A4C1XP91_EUMVA|nr:hypothetical protein EVAR_53450_1 [Eumeta japonica]
MYYWSLSSSTLQILYKRKDMINLSALMKALRNPGHTSLKRWNAHNLRNCIYTTILKQSVVTWKLQYNARNSAAVKFVTKASQRPKIATRRRRKRSRSVQPAHYIVRRHLERQSFARCTVRVFVQAQTGASKPISVWRAQRF